MRVAAVNGKCSEDLRPVTDVSLTSVGESRSAPRVLKQPICRLRKHEATGRKNPCPPSVPCVRLGFKRVFSCAANAPHFSFEVRPVSEALQPPPMT